MCTRTCCSSPAPSGTRWCTRCRGGQDGARQAEARPADRPDHPLHRRPAGELGLPDRRAAVFPRQGAMAPQRHLRRRGQYLPRPAGVHRALRGPRPHERRDPAAGSTATVPPTNARPRIRSTTSPTSSRKEAPSPGVRGASAPGHRAGEAIVAPPQARRAEGHEAADRAAARRVDLPRQGRRRPGPFRPGVRRRRCVESIVVDFPARRSGRTTTRRCATGSAPSGA